MAETQRRYSSRNNRPNKPGINKILNGLIALVVVLIVITAGIIFLGNGGTEKADSTKVGESDSKTKTETDSNEEDSSKSEEIDSKDETEEDGTEGLTTEEVEPTEVEDAAEEPTEDPESNDETTSEGGSVTSTPSNDPLVSESIVNSAWEPVKTSQTGTHASVYDKGHVDWNEKVQAISYATGLATNNMIIWQLSNGGGPQKSIGVVSSNDKQEKYRVYLQWVDGQGWKPEKMETLKTLEGAY
jgi:hypothetical protein